MPKSKLYHELSSRYNIGRLLRAEQRAVKKVSNEKKRQLEESENSSNHSSDKKLKSATLNEIDPIMLCKITKKKKFEFKKPNGTTSYFNVDSLIDYMISSGEFIDPQTRLPFNDDDLEAIDAKVRIKLHRHNKSYEFDALTTTMFYDRREALD
jgi:hypothetical protein